jgi:hypothetical protein
LARHAESSPCHARKVLTRMFQKETLIGNLETQKKDEKREEAEGSSGTDDGGGEEDDDEDTVQGRDLPILYTLSQE